MIGQCASAFFFGVIEYDFVLNPMFSMISVSRGYRPGQVLIWIYIQFLIVYRVRMVIVYEK